MVANADTADTEKVFAYPILIMISAHPYSFSSFVYEINRRNNLQSLQGFPNNNSRLSLQKAKRSFV